MLYLLVHINNSLIQPNNLSSEYNKMYSKFQGWNRVRITDLDDSLTQIAMWIKPGCDLI